MSPEAIVYEAMRSFLYNRTVKHGMSQKEAKDILRKLVEELS